MDPQGTMQHRNTRTEMSSLLRQIRDLGPTEPRLVGPSGQRPPTEDLRAGKFVVFGRPTSLKHPVNWRQDPHGNRSWRYELHTLTWLKPLLLNYAENREAASLATARDLSLDWAGVHLEPTSEVSEFAWYDMAVGLRAPYYAYLLRESLIEGDLPNEDADLLLRTAERHGAELADDGNYAAGHNHGLFQDEGLYLLAKQLPTLPSAEAWRELALKRMRSTLEQTISFTDGAHLEHSSAYQFSITNLVSRLADHVQEMPKLGTLRDALRKTAAWHVTPGGRLVQLGDTDDVPAPKWAQQAASRLHGINALFEAGQAFVRDGGSYLAVSAGHHSSAHKHADDMGFVLIEGGKVVVGDAGRWGYYEEPDRLYARSAFAHNVLTVDEQDFRWRESEPYGSGLLAAGEGDGWYAVLTTNPLCKQQGTNHRRLLLYRPAELLVIMDAVRAEEQHDYTRRFHFGPGLDARLDAEGQVALKGERTAAILADSGGDAKAELDCGRDEPARLGWTYPGDRERLPTWTATLHTRAPDATMAAVLSIRESAPEIIRAELDGDSATLETSSETVEVGFGEHAAAVVRRPTVLR
jgi:hypothetical protein